MVLKQSPMMVGYFDNRFEFGYSENPINQRFVNIEGIRYNGRQKKTPLLVRTILAVSDDS